MIHNTRFSPSVFLMTIGIGIVLLSFITFMRFKSSSQIAHMVTSMPSSSLTSSPDSTFDQESECSATSDQTIVEWKDMYWFSCKLSWHGICIWPPFRRRHVTFKVTLNGEIPIRDEKNSPIVIANGKRKNWLVYDSTSWNQIAESPRHLARYPEYEPILPNEYVVMVETRYRLFNDVESTLEICTQLP